MYHNALLVEQAKVIAGLAHVTPSSSTPDYVSMKNAEKLTVIVYVKNATTVTGSAITLKQATAVAGTGEKALAFDKMFANIDTAASDALVETAVTSNTFTTGTVDSKNMLYVMEIRSADLDTANGFDCVRAGTGNATNAGLSVMYIAWPLVQGTGVSSIVD